MQQVNSTKFISEKLQSHKSFVFGKKNKQKRQLLNPKYADSNPIYRVLKIERNNRCILDFIVKSFQPNETVLSAKTRAKSEIREKPHPQKSYFFNSKSAKNLQQFKQRAGNILSGTKKMWEGLDGSKRRIKILDKFNKRVDKYCSYLPENPQEQSQNESNIANDRLVQLCNETFFPTQNLHKRAQSLIHYSEPKIQNTRMRKLKARYKMISTIATTTQIQPGKRILRTQPSQ